MLNVHSILVNTFGFAVKFFVPTVVWITLTAGLFQLIYRAVYRAGQSLSASRPLAQRSVQQQEPVR